MATFKKAEIAFYEANAPERRLFKNGYQLGQFGVVNRGARIKWGVYELKTGLRIEYGIDTMKQAKDLAERLHALGPVLEGSTWGMPAQCVNSGAPDPEHPAYADTLEIERVRDEWAAA